MNRWFAAANTRGSGGSRAFVGHSPFFSNGFEGATLGTGWNVVEGTAMTQTTTTPISGAKSALYTWNGSTTTGAVAKDWASLTAGVYVQFKFKPANLVQGGASGRHRIFGWLNTFGALDFGHGATPSAGYQITGLGMFTGGTGTVLTAGTTYRIEVFYKPGPSAGAAADQAAWWVNGVLISSTSTFNDARPTQGCRVGCNAVTSGGLGTGTTLMFDDVYASLGPLAGVAA